MAVVKKEKKKMNGIFVGYSEDDVNKVKGVDLKWCHPRLESGYSVPILMKGEELVGFYKEGVITANKAFKVELIELGKSWKTNWVSKEDMILALSNTIVETTNKSKGEKPHKERCLHLEAKIVNFENAKCPQCGTVQVNLVFANLIEKLAQVNEAIWERHHLKSVGQIEIEGKSGKSNKDAQVEE